jgi:hypothetical protein
MNFFAGFAVCFAALRETPVEAGLMTSPKKSNNIFKLLIFWCKFTPRQI